MYKKTRAEGFGDEVKRRIMIGAYVLSEGYYDAYYLQAQKIRRMIADDFQAAFKECDVIAGAAAPTTAWAIGGKADPVSNYLADVFTLPASLAGLPGLSLPAGFGDGGLPVGLQLIGNYFCRKPSCSTRRTASSKPRTSTCNAPPVSKWNPPESLPAFPSSGTTASLRGSPSARCPSIARCQRRMRSAMVQPTF